MNWRLMLVASAVVAGAHSSSAMADNGSFESGDFTGWQLQIPIGLTEGPPPFTPMPAGTGAVVSVWSKGQDVRSPIDGSQLAILGSSEGFPAFIENAVYHITLSQTFSLNAGDTVSGWAAFFNGDYSPQDSAWVRLLDNSNNEIASPWMEFSGGQNPNDPNSVPYLRTTDWSYWEWQATLGGVYKLELGITTFGDNRLASYGLFDDIQIVPIPEPTAISILGLGFLGWFALRRKSKR